MTYKIVSKYIKDLSFEIPESKSYFLIEKDIKKYKFFCDINSKRINQNILEVNVSMRLESIAKITAKNINVLVTMASLIQIEEKVDKDKLEKIILIEVPVKIYPDIRNIIIFLFEKSGFKEIGIEESIDFKKLYESRKVQK